MIRAVHCSHRCWALRVRNRSLLDPDHDQSEVVPAIGGMVEFPVHQNRGLESHSRSDLGMTAPPHGLYLESIDHTLSLDDTWPYHLTP